MEFIFDFLLMVFIILFIWVIVYDLEQKFDKYKDSKRE